MISDDGRVYKKFLSLSNDWFAIPIETYSEDLEVYQKAAEDGDEKTMLLFEGGLTGWIYLEEYYTKIVVK